MSLQLAEVIIMNRIIVALVLVLAIFILPVWAGSIYENKAPIINYPALTGAEPLAPVQYIPTNPRLAASSPGDTVGFSQYDFQTNGSTGNRVVIDNLGNPHFAWMNAHPYPGTRHIYFNCLTADGSPYPGTGEQVSFRNMDGYTSIAVTPENQALVVYHNAATTGAESLFMAKDASSCLGAFDYFRPPDRFSGLYGIWPTITVNRNGNIHVVMITRTSSLVGYTRSTDGGSTWSAAQMIDTSGSISAIITSSPVSNKTAIVYTRRNIDIARPDTMSDIYYVQSEDGLVWNLPGGRVDVTYYYTDSDSVSAGSDLDAVYDYNDNLHIVWNAHWTSGGYYYYLSWLYHYSTASGIITQIIKSDSLWPSQGCATGAWNWHFCKMSLGVSAENKLVVTYTDFDTSDCSLAGYANGDIYAHYSGDGGDSWTDRVNLTNSQTPGCEAGDCDSDNWSTLAEKLDSDLHLFYVNDKDAGGVPQTEGVATDNPMLYLKLPVSTVGIKSGEPIPRNFVLNQNYPNPFNSSTQISYNLEKAEYVKIEIFDVTGRHVAKLLEGQSDAGPHTLTWNADNVTSGVYYYRLQTGKESQTRKMVFLK
jgi:hypothetical protein